LVIGRRDLAKCRDAGCQPAKQQIANLRYEAEKRHVPDDRLEGQRLDSVG
jgi:hypothetical protein